MNSQLSSLGDAFIALAAKEPLLTLSEGLVKIRCMEAALSLGCTLQEGAGTAPGGPVADFAVLRAGTIVWNRGPRRLQLPEGSADFAVVEPFQMLLEIKARPDYGTKSQAQFQQMDADVARVAQRRESAFLFVFDPKIYLSFSGEKTETRGRPAHAADWFTAHFPAIASIPTRRYQVLTVNRDTTQIEMAFRAIMCGSSFNRIVVLGCRADASF